VRRKLTQKGIHKDSVEEALARLKVEGITEVVLQPTHVIAGIEYDKIAEAVRKAERDFECIKLGKVLLSERNDYETVAEALANANKDITKDTALLWMGHGSPHQSGEAYTKMQHIFMEKGYHNYFMGTIEGTPSFEEALERLCNMEKQREKRYEMIALRPFMLVAGDHANHDMAGENDSWKTRLEKKGYKINALCTGLGEYEEIQALYMKHLEQLLEQM
jgi:sirohydrochlorin cobaltochelatase